MRVNFQGKGEMHTFWLIGEDKSVRQKRLYQVITPAILAQEKSFMEEQTTIARNSPRNQSYKSRRRATTKEHSGSHDPESSTFLDLIRNSESSSSLRLKGNPYKGSANNLSGRRFSNEVAPQARNGLAGASLKSRNLSKANSVDYCSEPVPAIVVDKAALDREDAELHARETDSLLPSQSVFAVNNAMQTGSPVDGGTELNCTVDLGDVDNGLETIVSSTTCNRRPEGETIM
jgi:hypothetical protein